MDLMRRTSVPKIQGFKFFQNLGQGSPALLSLTLKNAMAVDPLAPVSPKPVNMLPHKSGREGP